MKHRFLAVCALLGAPSVVLAQSSPTDAAAPVPPVVYQSVFADTPTGVEMNSVDWKKANAEVGQFTRGHVDILKWEESQRSLTAPAAAGKAPAASGAHSHTAKP